MSVISVLAAIVILPNILNKILSSITNPLLMINLIISTLLLRQEDKLIIRQ